MRNEIKRPLKCPICGHLYQGLFCQHNLEKGGDWVAHGFTGTPHEEKLTKALDEASLIGTPFHQPERIDMENGTELVKVTPKTEERNLQTRGSLGRATGLDESPSREVAGSIPAESTEPEGKDGEDNI